MQPLRSGRVIKTCGGRRFTPEREFTPAPKAVQKKGSLSNLPVHIRRFVQHWVDLCKPSSVYVCDGSNAELEEVMKPWVDEGVVIRLGTHRNSFLFRSTPRDTGSDLHSKTFFASPMEEVESYGEEVKTSCATQKSSLVDLKMDTDDKFHGCMVGRTMYVLPFAVGASRWFHPGVLLTDSPFVYLTTRTCVRVMSSYQKLKETRDKPFFRCVHSVGCPRPAKEPVRDHWPCQPDRAVLAYLLEELRFKCFGTGVLDPSRWLFPLVNTVAKETKWLVARMTVLAVSVPTGKEMFVGLICPTSCGLSPFSLVMCPNLPGYKMAVVSEGLTRLRSDGDRLLRAAGILNGLSGEARTMGATHPPELMKALQAKSVFLNVACSDKGKFYWEGLDMPSGSITNWRGIPWDAAPSEGRGSAAHKASRFFCPSQRYAELHASHDDTVGVPLSAIVFVTRRSSGVPLVYECKSWPRAVLTGACLKTDVTESQPNQPSPNHTSHPEATRNPNVTQDQSGTPNPKITQDQMVIQSTKENRDMKVTQSPKVAQDTQVTQKPILTTQDSKVNKNKKVSMDPKVTPKMNPDTPVTPNPKTKQGRLGTQDVKVTQDTKVTKTPKITQGPIGTQDVKVSEETKSTKTPKITQDPKLTPNPKAAQKPEAIRDPMANGECVMEGQLVSYLRQWLELPVDYGRTCRVFHANWLKYDSSPDFGHVTWPGLEESGRILDWILRRCDLHPDIAVDTPIGLTPRPGTINTEGLEGGVELDRLFTLPKDFWLEETRQARQFLRTKMGSETPQVLLQLLNQQEEELAQLPDEPEDLKSKHFRKTLYDRCHLCLHPPMEKNPPLC